MLSTVLLVGLGLGAALLLQAPSGPDIGPAVGAAREVDLRLIICNAAVDRLDLNPRTSELELEDLLRREGAESVDVVVERVDCPQSQPRS